MALNQEEIECLSLSIIHQLSQTPYACTSLKMLSGGTANFLFRGSLVESLPHGRKTVVVKHSKEFVSANRDFKLNISRCIYEVAMLNALTAFRPVLMENISVKTPYLYYFDRETATQVLYDLIDTVDIRTMLESFGGSELLRPSISTNLGHVLGAWLRSFHLWISKPAQAGLRSNVAENTAMRRTRYAISYGAFIDVVKKFPEIWEARKGVLEEVKDMATLEYANTMQDSAEEDWGIIHGDFWAGNALMINTPHLENNHRQSIDLFIIDWELVQLGRRAYDLGQMIGDLYERKHFTRDDSALRVIQGFIAGYGVLSDVEAFRIAIHVGQHLICWYIRRNPHAPFTEPLELIEALISIGTDFIMKGWEKDRKWFESSDLVYLFKRV